MALPGVSRIITGRTHTPKYASAVSAEAEKENSEYLRGRFKVNFAPNTKIDPNIIKLQILEMKIDEILSHPELTHLQLWNELKTLKDVVAVAEEESPSQNT